MKTMRMTNDKMGKYTFTNVSTEQLDKMSCRAAQRWNELESVREGNLRALDTKGRLEEIIEAIEDELALRRNVTRAS